MLDTYGRKYVNPLIDISSEFFLKLNINANQITLLGLIIGLFPSFFIYIEKPIIACIFLWISGYLDAVDGAVARKQKNTTAWGTLMDITFDRIVEMSMVIALALRFPQARIQLLLLTISILFSMTIFLTVGALSKQNGIKSFYYQAGLAERTEGFILFTLMVLLSKWLIYVINIFSIMVLITAVQRMMEAKKIFSKK
jgi:CDP-diacylglycerol--glycerol-3-phosphate 3-phosphatidyltransferase